MEFKDTKEQVEANLMLRINRNIMEFKDFLTVSYTHLTLPTT